jgi:putative serine protease PepD
MAVVAGSPAQGADLREGDIITKLGDFTVATVDDIHRSLIGDTIGREIAVSFLRDWVKLERTVVTPEEYSEE